MHPVYHLRNPVSPLFSVHILPEAILRIKYLLHPIHLILSLQETGSSYYNTGLSISRQPLHEIFLFHPVCAATYNKLRRYDYF